MDLAGTLVLPAAIAFTLYLLVSDDRRSIST